MLAAEEFASGCGELMRTAVWDTDDDFISWLTRLTLLEVPPELEDFRKARTAQYLMQTDASGDNIEVLGLNKDTQFWYERELWLVSEEMPDYLIQILVEGGCLGVEEVGNGKRMMAAWDRMNDDGGDFARPATVEDYLKSCADITLNAPIMDSADAQIEYAITWMGKLEPPPEVEDYHAAMMDVAIALREVGDITLVDANILRRVNDEAFKVGTDFVGLLVTSGCAG